MEQNFLQKIIKQTLLLLGETERSNNSFHLSYKHVTLIDQKFSGRTGNWYDEESWADRVEKTVETAFAVISEKRSDLSTIERHNLAKIIGVAAVRYWLIKFNTETTIKFSYEKVTDLKGDTAPFILYAGVRCKKILEKSTSLSLEAIKPDFDQLQSAEERELLIYLAKFPFAVENACENFRPHEIAEFAYRLASTFQKFYEKNPVIKGNISSELRKARLQLVKATLITLENALDLLGLVIPEEM